KLAEVLQTTAPMPVAQVTDRVSIEPDHVYVVSPNTGLEIVDDALIVSEMTRPEQRRAPVDLFFRTLALAHGPHSVAVVLSGTGANGSTGLKHVREVGGLTIAQDPKDAEYPDMPHNPIATGFVDLVLPIAQIPDAILSYFESVKRHGARGLVARRAADDDDEALRDVLTLLRVRTGQDFSNYKSA